MNRCCFCLHRDMDKISSHTFPERFILSYLHTRPPPPHTHTRKHTNTTVNSLINLPAAITAEAEMPKVNVTSSRLTYFFAKMIKGIRVAVQATVAPTS